MHSDAAPNTTAENKSPQHIARTAAMVAELDRYLDELDAIAAGRRAAEAVQ